MHSPDVRTKALKLAKEGKSYSEIAGICGVPNGTVGYWVWTARRSEGHPVEPQRASCPRCTDRPLNESSYSYLLGLYLGDGHIANTHRPGVHRLEISCCDTWPGLIEAAIQAIEEVMPGYKIGRRSRPGCTLVGAYSKHWDCLFPQHGPGMKHTRAIRLAPWQEAIVADFTEEFLRGLIHSDGCRVTNRIRKVVDGTERCYEYPRYFFTNASDDIRALFTDALDRLGIAWRLTTPRNISVARKEAVARLDEFVGPKY